MTPDQIKEYIEPHFPQIIPQPRAGVTPRKGALEETGPCVLGPWSGSADLGTLWIRVDA